MKFKLRILFYVHCVSCQFGNSIPFKKKELQREKRVNEYFDAQIPLTKYVLSCCFRIVSGNANYFSLLLDSNLSKYSMKSQKFGHSNTYIFTNWRKTNVCFFSRWKRMSASGWPNLCLFTQTFILNDKEILMSTDNSKKNLEWMTKKKQQKCHSQHSKGGRRTFTEFVYFAFPASECFSFKCVRLYSDQLFIYGIKWFLRGIFVHCRWHENR